jgi:hypothetical protein
MMPPIDNRLDRNDALELLVNDKGDRRWVAIASMNGGFFEYEYEYRCAEYEYRLRLRARRGVIRGVALRWDPSLPRDERDRVRK